MTTTVSPTEIDVGTRFGKWTVIERLGPSVSGRAQMLCKCECGIERPVATHALRSGSSKSCGCLGRAIRKAASGIIISCIYCGGQFKVSPSRKSKRRYCSAKCQEAARRNRRVTKACERCGKEFVTTISHNKARFCSQECAYPAQIQKFCQTCGKEYFVTARHKNSRFCSRMCRTQSVKNICKFCGSAFYTRPSRTRDFCGNNCSKASMKKRVTKLCSFCGREYEIRTSLEETSKFCSKSCQEKFRQEKRVRRKCKYCGVEFEITSSHVGKTLYCSKECLSRDISFGIDVARTTAAEHNGKCLSKTYTNGRRKLLWECSEGHRWKAIFNSVERGTWCPHCAGQHKTIEDMQKLAISRGGRCISTEYMKAKEKVLWECALGHRWYATPDHVLRGRWCRQCSSGLGERVCREFFEQLFRVPFPKTRPKWLRALSGRLLELDGYCEKLQLAFEHHGVQHYRRIHHFQRSDNSLETQTSRDKLKHRLCHEKGITLIEVPQIPDLLPLDEVQDFIIEQCHAAGRVLPKTFDNAKVDLKAAYSTATAADNLKLIRQLAEKKGGKCLSEQYVTSNTKLQFQCAKGHLWMTLPSVIKNGSWCPYCVGRHKTIEDMVTVATSRGGNCLSDTYTNPLTKLEWQCEYGHTWRAVAQSVYRGSWCPVCAKINKKN